MIQSSQPRFVRRTAFMLCLLVALVTSIIAPAAAEMVYGPIVGSDTSTLGNYGKPNQSRIWYNSHAQRWDALIPKNDDPGDISASDHYILTDVPGNQTFTAVELEDRNTAREDAFWDDAGKKLYVMGSHGRQTQFWRLGYDQTGDSYNLEVGWLGTGVTVPGISHDSRNRPASLYVTPNGRVWVGIMNDGELAIQHSSDGGLTWLPSAVTLDTNVRNGVTTWIHFEHNGTTYAGLFAGENGESQSTSENFYWFIDQNEDPINLAKWTNDSINIPGPVGVELADDHVAAARDNANNQYFVIKTENGNATDPLIKLLRRTAEGTWSQYKVTETQERPEQSRPALVVDEENGEIYVYTNVTESGINAGFDITGMRKKASLNALEELAGAPLVPLFNEPDKVFTDVITPRQAVNSASNVVVLAHNKTDFTIWYSSETIESSSIDVATFQPVADAYIDQDKPNENKGDDDKLKLKADSGKRQISFLRFDVQGLSGNVVEATLYLYAKDDEHAGFDVHAVSDNSWQEMAITYNNAPALGQLVNHGSPTRNDKWVGVDVTALVNGPGSFSLALVDKYDKLEFKSREANEDEVPVLVVKTSGGTTATSAIQDVYGLNPIADAYVKQDKPKENKGDDDKLELKAEAGKQEIAYLTFDVPALTGNVADATLYLFAKEDSPNSVAVHAVASGAWDESEINFGNAPALGSLISLTGPTRNDRWLAVDVTAAISGAGQVSLALVENVDKNEFVSREGDQAPLLVIRTAAGATSSAILPAGAFAINPVADAYVNQEKPHENKGDDDKLKLQAESGKDEISYLRFDTTGFAGDISQATLYLYAKDKSRTGFYVFAGSSNDWAENSLTYSNAPAAGPLIAHSGAVNNDHWIAIDVTKLAASQDLFTLILVSNGDQIEIESRESGKPPLLVVTTKP